MHKKSHTPLSRRKKVILAVGGVIFVAAVAGGVAVYLKNNAPNSADAEQQVPVVQAPISGSQAIADANTLIAQGDVTGANKALDEAIASSSSNQEKANLYSLKSSATSNTDVATAIDYAKTAADLDPSAGLYAYVAELAERSGDKALAIEYYQKAIDDYKANPPVETNSRGVEDFQTKIDALRG